MALPIGVARFTLQDLVDRAVARCKVPSQQLPAELGDIAKKCLTLALTALSNAGTPLWTVERILLPLTQGQGRVQLPAGTVDLMKDSVNYRTATRSGDSYISAEGTAANAGDGDILTSTTQTSINGNLQIQFLTPT